MNCSFVCPARKWGKLDLLYSFPIQKSVDSYKFLQLKLNSPTWQALWNEVHHASAHGLVLRALLLCGGFRLPAPAGTELQRGRSKLGGQRRLLTRAPFVQAVEGFTWGKYVKKRCQNMSKMDGKWCKNEWNLLKNMWKPLCSQRKM